MKLFINSADLEEIKTACTLNVADGVTTNPSATAKMGKNYKNNLLKICDIVDGPVCAQVMSSTTDDMVKEAKEIDAFHEKTLVKIPLTMEGAKAIRILHESGIQVNTTVIFSIAQALIALRAGANYVSLFTGPKASADDGNVSITPQVRKIIDTYDFDAKIIDCVRSPEQTVQAALNGADICTMDFQYLKMLFESPWTVHYLDRFQKAWNTVYKGQTWLSQG